MRWHDWLGTGLVAYCVAVCGCVHDQQTLTGYPNDGAAALAAPSDHDSVDVARSQQPDGHDATGPKTPPSIHDVPPKNVGELAIQGIPAARIRATVNGEAILDEEVKAACYPQLRRAEYLPEPQRSQTQAAIFKDTLEQIVEREAILQAAFALLKKNAGDKSVQKLRDAADKEFETQWIKPILKGNPQFKTEAEFKTALQSENISLDMMKRQWTRHFMADQFMRQMVATQVDKIGHLQVLDYYTKHPEEFQIPDSVQWEDVFVAEALHPPRAAARERAEAILARMRKGEKVEQLMKERLNDGDSVSRGGGGLGSKHGEIKPPEVEAPLFQLKDGEAALVEMEAGYHVVRVVKREYAGMIDFNDPKMQKRIKDKLRSEIGQDAMKKLAKKLRSEAVIEYAKATN